MQASIDDMKRYCEYMEDVKRRVHLLRSFLGGTTTLGANDLDYEIVCVNLRKILELIAFSSLVANKDKYSEAHEKYASHWKINQLLANIEKLNPDFYPKPLAAPVVGELGEHHFPEGSSEHLTRDEFVKLMNLCADVLHVWNPYTSRVRSIDFERPILEWIDRIQGLLDFHCVRLADTTDVMLVIMHDSDGKVHAYYGTGVGPIEPS